MAIPLYLGRLGRGCESKRYFYDDKLDVISKGVVIGCTSTYCGTELWCAYHDKSDKASFGFLNRSSAVSYVKQLETDWFAVEVAL